MVPAPIVIKLKPVQTKKIIAATNHSPEFNEKSEFSPEIPPSPARHDSNIAERTPIDEVSYLWLISYLRSYFSFFYRGFYEYYETCSTDAMSVKIMILNSVLSILLSKIIHWCF